jgi:hypothetical protein
MSGCVPEWLACLCIVFAALHAGLCIHSAHMADKSAFWRGYYDAITLRIFWDRSADRSGK